MMRLWSKFDHGLAYPGMRSAVFFELQYSGFHFGWPPRSEIKTENPRTASHAWPNRMESAVAPDGDDCMTYACVEDLMT